MTSEDYTKKKKSDSISLRARWIIFGMITMFLIEVCIVAVMIAMKKIVWVGF